MELKEAIEKRKSIRRFTEEGVKINDLKEMVRRAGLAPSVNNYQPWKFLAIINKELLHTMANIVSDKISSLPESRSKAAKNVKSQVEWYATFFKNAPALVALIMEDYETILEKGVDISHEEINIMRNYPDIQSAGGAMENLLLTAVELGYGACWLSAPLAAKDELETLLNITSPWRLMSFAAIGRPAADPKQKNKKSLDEIFVLID